MSSFVEPVFPMPNDVDTLLQSIPDLHRWEVDKDLPHHYDLEVRKLRGHRGEGFLSAYPKIKFHDYWSPSRRLMETAVFFSHLCEGPPGAAHGGSIAAAFDHILGRFMWRFGGFGGNVTLNLNTDYKKFVPLNTVVRCTSQVVSQDGRKTRVQAQLTNADGSVVHSTCSALFYNHTGKVVTYDEILKRLGRMTREQYIEAVRNPADVTQRVKKPAKSKL